MAETRSALLAVGLLSAAGWWKAYTSPAGVTTLIKSIYLTNTVGSTFRVESWIHAAGQEVMVMSTTLAAFGTANIQGWNVLGPGHELHFANYGNYGVSCWVSGTHLLGVSPHPPQTPSGPTAFES